MPLPTLNTPIQRFYSSEKRYSDLVNRSISFCELRSAQLRPILIRDKYLIAEISFLGLILEWELFIEEIFCRFICNSRRFSSPQPRLNARFNSIQAAKLVIRGRQGFINWLNPDEIIRLSKLYFQNGEPFYSPIRAAYLDLEGIRIIRNRIAHSSDKAHGRFQNFIRNKYGFYPRGITPGRFLSDRLPSTHSPSEYAYYSQNLLVLSQLITGQRDAA